MTARRFVVLDRDGTIIEDRHYLTDPDQVTLIPNVAAGLRELRDLGLGLIVITNQSAVGRGFLDRDRLDQIHRRMAELLAAEGIELAGIYVCPHLPEDGCACRKPLLGLLQEASEELGFDPELCFVIGDKPCDVELGRCCGATAFLVRTGHGEEYVTAGAAAADFIVADVAAAAEIIKGLVARQGENEGRCRG